jgi:hypothetical protein
MRYLTWLRSEKRSHPAERRGGHGPSRRRATVRPRLELLEDRRLPSTLTVTNNLDSGSGSLRAEIAAAKNNDTIVFASSLSGQTINLTSGELVINKSLTVQGLGAGQLAVSGGGLSRVLEVDYAKKQNVTVSGLTLENGYAAAGGAILNNGTLTINGCTVTGNDNHNGVGQLGGGIDNPGTLTISGCTITGNTAMQGGGIYNWNLLTISNSTLSGNIAPDGGEGGAIYNFGSTTISNSTLSGNSAETQYDPAGDFPGHGGAIDNYAGSLTLSDSTLSDNSAAYGSAIYMDWQSTNVAVTGCTLTDSNPSDLYLIFVSGGSLTVKNSYFHNDSGPSYIAGPYTDGGGNTFAGGPAPRTLSGHADVIWHAGTIPATAGTPTGRWPPAHRPRGGRHRRRPTRGRRGAARSAGGAVPWTGPGPGRVMDRRRAPATGRSGHASRSGVPGHCRSPDPGRRCVVLRSVTGPARHRPGMRMSARRPP